MANKDELAKREKLLEVVNYLMNLWKKDTRDAESRILVITHDSKNAELLEKWLNNEFANANMATSIYPERNQFVNDLAIKMFFYNPSLSSKRGNCQLRNRLT